MTDEGCRQAEPLSEPDPTLVWRAGREEYLIIFSLSILSVVVALDATILVPVLPSIASELQGTTVDTFWAGSAYLLTNAVFQPFIVGLSNDFGRRPLLCVSVLLFTVGTLICCLSVNFPTLLAGRSIQGIGGGGVLSLNNVILTDMIPLRHRPTYFAATQLSWSIGTITGPLIGGLFADHTTWRWVFYINFPFCFVGLVLVLFNVKLRVEVPTMKVRLLRMDWFGMALFTSSAGAFLVGITCGGTVFPWGSWRTIVPISLGLLGLCATGLWETYGTRRPFLPTSLLKTFSATAAYIGALFQGMLLFFLLYYVPVYFQGVRDKSPTATGVALIAVSGPLVPSSIVTGMIIRRTGRYRWAIWSGWLIITLASGLLVLFRPDTHDYVWILILIISGLGHGLVLIALNIGTQSMADGPDIGHAALLYILSRSFGMCLGVALGSAVFQNTLKIHLASENLPPELASNIEGLFHQIHGTSFARVIRLPISKSFNNVAEVMTGIAAIAGLISLFIKSRSVDRKFQPKHILQRASGSHAP